MILLKIVYGILNLFKSNPTAIAVDKTLANFGSMSAMERTHVDTFTENRINSIKDEPIAKSKYGIIYTNNQEIDIYNILNTTIISATNIKSQSGSIIIFEKDGVNELELNSDEKIIKSDFSNVSNRWITELSFYLSKDELAYINKREFDKIHLEYNKKTMLFLVI